MKINDVYKVNSMIEHFKSLQKSLEILKSDAGYKRVSIDADDGNFNKPSSRTGVYRVKPDKQYAWNDATEIYEGFTEDLIKVFEKRKNLVLKILNKYGVDCVEEDLIVE